MPAYSLWIIRKIATWELKFQHILRNVSSLLLVLPACVSRLTLLVSSFHPPACCNFIQGISECSPCQQQRSKEIHKTSKVIIKAI